MVIILYSIHSCNTVYIIIHTQNIINDMPYCLNTQKLCAELKHKNINVYFKKYVRQMTYTDEKAWIQISWCFELFSIYLFMINVMILWIIFYLPIHVNRITAYTQQKKKFWSDRFLTKNCYVITLLSYV